MRTTPGSSLFPLPGDVPVPVEPNPIEAAQEDARACVAAGDIRGAEAVWKRFAEGHYDR